MSTQRIAAFGFLGRTDCPCSLSAAAEDRGKASTTATITAIITSVHGMIARIGTNTAAEPASRTDHASAFIA